MTYDRETPIFDALVSRGSSRVNRANSAGPWAPSPGGRGSRRRIFCARTARITREVISVNGGFLNCVGTQFLQWLESPGNLAHSPPSVSSDVAAQ